MVCFCCSQKNIKFKLIMLILQSSCLAEVFSITINSRILSLGGSFKGRVVTFFWGLRLAKDCRSYYHFCPSFSCQATFSKAQAHSMMENSCKSICHHENGF